MSYSFACGDVMPGCPVTFQHGSRDELLNEVASHAASAHGVTDLPPAVLGQVESAIRFS